MASSVRVEGLSETIRAVRQIDRQLPREFTKIGRAAADVVAKEAQRRAPVGGGPRSPRDPHPGALRASVRPGSTQRGAVVRAGNARVPYAAVVHWGSKAVKKVAPRPFILEAREAKIGEVGRVYDAGVDEFLTRIGW